MHLVLLKFFLQKIPSELGEGEMITMSTWLIQSSLIIQLIKLNGKNTYTLSPIHRLKETDNVNELLIDVWLAGLFSLL